MAWFWGSSSTDTKPSSPSSQNPTAEPQNSTSNPVSQPQSTESPNPSSIDSFIQNLEEETRIASSKFQRRSQLSSSDETSPPIEKTLGQIEDDLLPTDISIRQAFDAAFYCQSLGGKFNDIYRYGELKSCGGHWKDFWFAMRIRSTREPIRSEMIKDHFRHKALKHKIGPSSEDVWKSRDTLISTEEAFPHPFPKMGEVTDEEWQAQENERRRKIRGALFGKENAGGGAPGI